MDPKREDFAARRVELLAPAGSPEMMRAAVENGADAIYFGLEEFNARMRAANFAADDLPRIMSELHERGVRGYVTLNTLIFTGEMDRAAGLLRACSDAGVDAVLVQDLGLAALASRLVPNLPLHASTQMTLSSAEAVRGAEALGLRIERMVAPRELTLDQIRALCGEAGIEVEAFAHGALCISYSGQCSASLVFGGRSANRGECAQPCRLPYCLVADGQEREADDCRYPLSPQDLCAYEVLDDLARAGIAALKIEGRLKTPQYVAAVTQVYREALDRLAEQREAPMSGSVKRRFDMTFNRGFTTAHLYGTNHRKVIKGKSAGNRGQYVGVVRGVQGSGVEVRLCEPVRPGDGVMFVSRGGGEDGQGARVFSVEAGRNASGIPAALYFRDGDIRLNGVRPGDCVWKTSDAELERELAASYSGAGFRRKSPVAAMVKAAVGRPLQLTMRDGTGNEASVLDTVPAEEAREQPLTRKRLEEHIGRLGNTPFALQSLELDVSGNVMIPFSRLNALRRRCAEALLEKRRAAGRGRTSYPDALESIRLETGRAPSSRSVPADVSLSVLCRTLDQVRAIAELPEVAAVYTDFSDLDDCRKARSLAAGAGKRWIAATLRIQTPGGDSLEAQVAGMNPDGLLIRNLGAFHIARQSGITAELIADHTLNVANDLSAALLLRGGFTYVTPGNDVSGENLQQLLGRVPGGLFEIVIHQHTPMFHMEHCLFCRFLSGGGNRTDCGRVCRRHALELQDRKGYRHPVQADAGCRNTVFNAVPQSAAESVTGFVNAGVRRFRIELLDEDAGLARSLATAYAKCLRGGMHGKDLWRELRDASPCGLTRSKL